MAGVKKARMPWSLGIACFAMKTTRDEARENERNLRGKKERARQENIFASFSIEKDGNRVRGSSEGGRNSWYLKRQD